ncbi:MAG: hypothetical protein M3Y71_17485 [Actinomycetota bacterium]|nr:hypothetical protein [Actinomycetota bacterium]
MDIDEQLGRLRPSIEVEMLVRQVVSSRAVDVARRGEELIISRLGSDAPAMHCYPAVVSLALDPARARALEGTPLVERVESKTTSTSYVWVPTARLRGALDEAVSLAQEAVDRLVRSPAPTRTRSTAPRSTAPRSTPAAAVPPPPEPKICPRCGLQISAAGSCFCD